MKNNLIKLVIEKLNNKQGNEKVYCNLNELLESELKTAIKQQQQDKRRKIIIGNANANLSKVIRNYGNGNVVVCDGTDYKTAIYNNFNLINIINGINE